MPIVLIFLYVLVGLNVARIVYLQNVDNINYDHQEELLAMFFWPAYVAWFILAIIFKQIGRFIKLRHLWYLGDKFYEKVLK